MDQLGASGTGSGNGVTRVEARCGGVGIFGLLGIAFIVLKLTHVIDWSWWWVLAPFWIPFALFLFMALMVAIVGAATPRKRR